MPAKTACVIFKEIMGKIKNSIPAVSVSLRVSIDKINVITTTGGINCRTRLNYILYAAIILNLIIIDESNNVTITNTNIEGNSAGLEAEGDCGGGMVIWSGSSFFQY